MLSRKYWLKLGFDIEFSDQARLLAKTKDCPIDIRTTNIKKLNWNNQEDKKAILEIIYGEDEDLIHHSALEQLPKTGDIDAQKAFAHIRDINHESYPKSVQFAADVVDIHLNEYIEIVPWAFHGTEIAEYLDRKNNNELLHIAKYNQTIFSESNRPESFIDTFGQMAIYHIMDRNFINPHGTIEKVIDTYLTIVEAGTNDKTNDYCLRTIQSISKNSTLEKDNQKITQRLQDLWTDNDTPSVKRQIFKILLNIDPNSDIVKENSTAFYATHEDNNIRKSTIQKLDYRDAKEEGLIWDARNDPNPEIAATAIERMNPKNPLVQKFILESAKIPTQADLEKEREEKQAFIKSLNSVIPGEEGLGIFDIHFYEPDALVVKRAAIQAIVENFDSFAQNFPEQLLDKNQAINPLAKNHFNYLSGRNNNFQQAMAQIPEKLKRKKVPTSETRSPNIDLLMG